MKRIYWEIYVILKVPTPYHRNIELIPCEDKRTAIRIANKIKEHKYKIDYDYDAIYIQAHNGAELLDDREMRIV